MKPKSVEKIIFELIKWFVSPSWMMLAGAASVVVPFSVIMTFAPTEPALRLPADFGFIIQKHLGANIESFDGSFRLYNQLTRLKETAAAKQGNMIIAYVGGSTLRGSIWSEAALEAMILEQSKVSVHAFDLTSPSQTLMESWVATEVAACSGAKLVILGLNIPRLRNTGLNNPSQTVGYRGNDAATYMQSGHNNQGDKNNQLNQDNSIQLNVRSLMRLIYKIIIGCLANSRDDWRNSGTKWYSTYVNKQNLSTQKLQQSISEIERISLSPPDREILGFIVKTTERCSSKLIVAFPPINPLLYDIRQYPGVSTALAEQLSLSRHAGLDDYQVIDINAKGNWRMTDFSDWGHIRSKEAMIQSMKIIAKAIGPLVAGNDTK